MEEIKLSDDVFEQIKDFNRYRLTEEQKLIIDKLILNEELKNRYKNYGLCEECKQPNIGYVNWCLSCNGKRFQISKIGLVEIMTSMSLFKEHN